VAGEDGRARARDDDGVTREQAMQRVKKLQAVTVQRGATPFEAAAAADRAARLVARFALRQPAAAVRGPRAPAQAQAYATAARTDRRSPRSMRFVGFA
jgi:hypothetical protein